MEIWSCIADDGVAKADAFIDRLYETVQLLAANLTRGVSERSWLRGCKVFPLAGTSSSTEWSPARLKLSVCSTVPGTSRVFSRAKAGILMAWVTWAI